MSDNSALNRFALGTVQFGMDYGIANHQGQTSHQQTSKILSIAKKHGITTLDTAHAYGNSEENLGAIGIDNWDIITKLPSLPKSLKNTKEVEKWINDSFNTSCLRLRQTSVYGLLLHRSSDLQGEHSQTLISTLHQLKQQKKIKALGISIYDPKELDTIPAEFNFDIVQAPFNVFDQRILTSGCMQKLQSKGCQLHTRSTFLQGLLLMPKETWPSYFKPWFSELSNWLTYCENNSITPLKAAIDFVLSQQNIDRVIIGVDNLNQLNAIININNPSNTSSCNHLQQHNLNLIDPSKWQLN